MSRYLDVLITEKREREQAARRRWTLWAVLVLMLLVALLAWHASVGLKSGRRLVSQQNHYQQVLDDFNSLSRAAILRHVTLFDGATEGSHAKSWLRERWEPHVAVGFRESCLHEHSDNTISLLMQRIVSIQRNLDDWHWQQRDLLHRAAKMSAQATDLAGELRSRSTAAQEEQRYLGVLPWSRALPAGETIREIKRERLDQLRTNRRLSDIISTFDTLRERKRSAVTDLELLDAELEKYQKTLRKHRVVEYKSNDCVPERYVPQREFLEHVANSEQRDLKIVKSLENTGKAVGTLLNLHNKDISHASGERTALLSVAEKLEARLREHQTMQVKYPANSGFLLRVQFPSFVECHDNPKPPQFAGINRIAEEVLSILEQNPVIAILRFEGGHDERPADNCKDEQYNESISYRRAKNLAKVLIKEINDHYLKKHSASTVDLRTFIYFDAYHLRYPECISNMLEGADMCDEAAYRKDRQARLYIKYVDRDNKPDPFLEPLSVYEHNIVLTSPKPIAPKARSKRE